jgi:diguanylate cyclase (GGDEF)-like protein
LPVEAIVALIVIAVVANMVLLTVLVARLVTRRRPAAASPLRPVLLPTPTAIDAASGEAGVVASLLGDAPDEGTARSGDRVVRIVSWTFIVVTAVLVTLSGLWIPTQLPILVLLAAAGLFVIVLHDLLPPDALGTSRFGVEGTVALTGAAGLIAMTGGATSPFFFTIPLIVAGAALVVSRRATIALTLAGALAYGVAVVLAAWPDPLDEAAVVAIVVNLMALLLLASVVMVIAREQRSARDAAIRLSTIDPLTGLYNRNFFFAAIEGELARSARSGRGFCLLMMDLDELKGINDRFGHFHGDRVLRAVGEIIALGVRRLDTAARYGGDEFVVLLPETDPTGAFVLAEKIRLGVRAMPLELPGDGPRPSLSIGVVAYPDDGRTVDELMISADGAMYASKRAGKDRVTGAPVAIGRIA